MIVSSSGGDGGGGDRVDGYWNIEQSMGEEKECEEKWKIRR